MGAFVGLLAGLGVLLIRHGASAPVVAVKNIGDEPQSFFGENVKAFDAQGREYSPSTEAALYLDNAKSLYEELTLEYSITGHVVFDVPMGTALTSIELHDSAFSGGVTVQL